MKKPRSPCYTCTRHAKGCHNPDTCPEWATYLQEQAEYRRQWLAWRRREYDYSDYKANLFGQR